MTFDKNNKVWIASWKWTSGHTPSELKNKVLEYTVPDHARDVYEKELLLWHCNRWLLPYPEKELGLPKGLIPLMVIVQEHKQKVQLVLTYCKLNEFVEAFNTNADVCAQKLREW